MEIRETDLPGIGRKFQADIGDGERIVIVVHDNGRRELYQFEEDKYEECVASFSVDDTEARRLAAILGGMAYTPRALENVEIAFDELVIEWYKVEPGSPAENRTIGELGVRQTFGTTIVAIIEKDQSKVINPGPEERINPGATLIVTGERSQVGNLKAALTLEEA